MPSLRVCPALLQNQEPASIEPCYESVHCQLKRINRKSSRTHFTRTHLITEDLVQRSVGLYETIHSSQPQTQKAVVDALHQHNLGQDEDRVPDVAAEMTAHSNA